MLKMNELSSSERNTLLNFFKINTWVEKRELVLQERKKRIGLPRENIFLNTSRVIKNNSNTNADQKAEKL